jgi:D-xylose transport system substrate-binding protein
MKDIIKFRCSKVVIVVFLLVSIFGCKSQSDIKIGFLIPASVGFRWPTDQKYVEKTAKELGVEVFTISAENDENQQLKQANDLLNKGVDVLIVVPVNANTSAAIVRDAHDQGVPVIGYDRLIANSDLDYLVTFDGAKIGELMVNHALELKPRGNYVLLWGDAGDVNAIFIKDAQEKILAPHIASGDINIIYKTFVEDWSTSNSHQMMKQIVSKTDKKIDAIITSYDGLAIGALNAMREYGIEDKFILTGQDAELASMKAIVNGDQSMTVYKSIRTVAETSVKLAIKLAKNQKVTEVNGKINNGRKDVPTILLTPQAVTKSNIQSTVIADGFYTEQEIYGK